MQDKTEQVVLNFPVMRGGRYWIPAGTHKIVRKFDTERWLIQIPGGVTLISARDLMNDEFGGM